MVWSLAVFVGTAFAMSRPCMEQFGKIMFQDKAFSLRDVARTTPYSHNGYFLTLREIIKFKNTQDFGEWEARAGSNKMVYGRYAKVPIIAIADQSHLFFRTLQAIRKR